ncbi:MAG: hypothetical protein U0414_23060 [Polyangiaceae bacterium]
MTIDPQNDGAPATTSSGPTGGDCSHANPFIWGPDCALSNEGTICHWDYADTGYSGGGLIQCTAGKWVEVKCPFIDTGFTCPAQGEPIEECPSSWNGAQCPWSVADAGFDCSGTATCVAGQWTSNGATYTPVGNGGAGGWGAGGSFGSTGSVGGAGGSKKP